MRRWEMVWFLGLGGDGPPEEDSYVVQQVVQNYLDAIEALQCVQMVNDNTHPTSYGLVTR